MRILVANHTLDMWGGSECYAYAVIEELVRRGHDVEVFTTRPGCVSEELQKRFDVYMVRPPAKTYDLQLVSHGSCAQRLAAIGGFKIQTCHGTLPSVEQPVRGMDRYVAISEEVREYLGVRGFESALIRNGVDCRRFDPKRPIRERPERVLAVVQTKEAEEFVAKACGLAGLELRVRNKFTNGGVFRIEDDMNEADIVVSLGRGAYEAMACARNVYIFDARRYQGALAEGMVTADNITGVMECNCSGRRFQRKITPRIMADELIYGYQAKRGEWLRAFAVQHLNIRTQVDKYLALYREAA